MPIGNNGLICPIMLTITLGLLCLHRGGRRSRKHTHTRAHSGYSDSLFFGCFLIITLYWKEGWNTYHPSWLFLYWNPLHRSSKRQWIKDEHCSARVSSDYSSLKDIKRDPKNWWALHSWKIRSWPRSFSTTREDDVSVLQMSLSSPTPLNKAPAAPSSPTTVMDVSHIEGHLMSRFNHLDPDLVDEYLSGRRRQVSFWISIHVPCLDLNERIVVVYIASRGETGRRFRPSNSKNWKLFSRRLAILTCNLSPSTALVGKKCKSNIDGYVSFWQGASWRGSEQDRIDGSSSSGTVRSQSLMYTSTRRRVIYDSMSWAALCIKSYTAVQLIPITETKKIVLITPSNWHGPLNHLVSAYIGLVPKSEGQMVLY